MMTNRVREKLIPDNVYGGDTESLPHNILSGCRLVVYVNITKVVGSGAIVVSIFEEAPGGSWVSLLSSASLTSAGSTRLEIGPGIAVTANVSRNGAIVGRYKVKAVFTGTPPTDGVEFNVSAIEAIGG